MKKKVLINGMSCMRCVKHVKEALESLNGVEAVEVSLPENCAIVSGDVSEEAIVNILKENDYEVINIEKVA